MSNSQWHDDQAYGERAQREHVKEQTEMKVRIAELELKLGEAEARETIMSLSLHEARVKLRKIRQAAENLLTVLALGGESYSVEFHPTSMMQMSERARVKIHDLGVDLRDIIKIIVDP